MQAAEREAFLRAHFPASFLAAYAALDHAPIQRIDLFRYLAVEPLLAAVKDPALRHKGSVVLSTVRRSR